MKNGAEIWDRTGDHSFLYVYSLKEEKSVLLKEFDRVIEAPNYSPDGTYLTYNSEGKIYRYDLDSGCEKQIDTGFVTNCNNDHVLMPDGTGIVVSHNSKEDGLSRIYQISFDNSSQRLITPLAPSYLHGISPDSKTIAYCACRNDKFDIYTLNIDAGEEKRLTTAFGLNDGPEFTKDGSYIWFNSCRSGLMQAYRMKADGSEQTQMTFCEGIDTWFPHISPDGKKVVMLAYYENDVDCDEHVPNKNVQIRLMNSDGTNLHTIIKLFGGQGTINVNSWSPDSNCFAYVSYSHLGN